MLLSDEISCLLKEVTGMNTSTAIMQQVAERALRSITSPHSDQVCFRASSIGKPWILQVLNRWYPSNPVFSVSTCMNMLDGIVAQAWLEEMLGLARYEYESEKELRLQVGEIEVVGHSDIIVTNHTLRQKVVIECKSMGGHVISKFYANPHDDFGYVSQLSFYTSMIRRMHPEYTVEPMFILYDRSLGAFKSCHLADHVVEQKFGRVERALEGVASVPMYDIGALLDTVLIPPPMGSIPPSMKWSKWSKCFYYEEGGITKMYEKHIAKQLIENMTQNKIGAM